MKLVILGPPGSGKGTYSSEIESRLDIEHISTGDLCREAIEEGGEMSEKIKKYYEKGKLVPDKFINQMLKEELKEIDMDDFILDGYPRTVEQAKFLDGIIDLDGIIRLDVSDSIIIERLSARRICKDCGEVYNKLFLKPGEEGICDECGGELYQREDDRPEVVKDRLEKYKKRSKQVLDFYRDKIPFEVLKVEETSLPIDEMVDKILEKAERKNLLS
ncbi:hypothetical protein AKJ51_02750 [candidate division MSBL1 archaeon SCGC-AAA382A20]|uniref:Adenylate kinase n=1 Tax=candidate division MSBL1 archaeon SCGC-AAA382A20 TaxID=1698280 RepID=A0A133VK70_9EURY|nr:hypothetical protein AKJ51_02750 [candidate division MSBL1 archaeon SCGC-AAA382A20]